MIGAAVLALLLLPSVASWSFKVTMSARLEGDEMPLVVGATNLPDGTALIVTLQRKGSRYMAQAKTGVTSGAFRAGPFSQKGAPLNLGAYTVSVTSAVASLQPASVRSVIGQGGSNLEGPLIKPSFAGKAVEWEGSLKLGRGPASPDKDRVEHAEAAKEKREWRIRAAHCADCLANFEQKK